MIRKCRVLLRPERGAGLLGAGVTWVLGTELLPSATFNLRTHSILYSLRPSEEPTPMTSPFSTRTHHCCDIFPFLTQPHQGPIFQPNPWRRRSHPATVTKLSDRGSMRRSWGIQILKAHFIAAQTRRASEPHRSPSLRL